MAVKSSVVGLFVFVLLHATQDVPCVSARNLLQFPLGNLPNGVNGINDALKGAFPGATVPPRSTESPAAPANGPPKGLPGANVGNLFSGVTQGVTGALNGPLAPKNLIPGALQAPLPGVGDVLGAAGNIVGNVASAAGNIAGNVASTAGNVVSGATGALKGLPAASTLSTPKAEGPPGTTITETFYISSTGLGSTTVTATTFIPPLNEIQIPDFKGFLSKFVPKSSTPPKSESSKTPPGTK